MADDQSQTRPLVDLINAAKEGRLTVRMDLEKFVYLDRDCEFFKDAIVAIQTRMTRVSQQEAWGLGESFPGQGDRDLVSGKTMVHRWREKSRGAENSVYAVMESHYKVIDDFQQLFRAVREHMTGVDTEQAARYRELEATLPQQAPAQPKTFNLPSL